MIPPEATNLSELIDENFITDLKSELKNKTYSNLNFKDAMQFFLTDGIIPKSNLDPKVFLKLEDWARNKASTVLCFSATELKNKTGTIIEQALKGHTVHIIKHGRAILEINGL